MSLLATGGIMAAIGLFMLNLAMQYYEQIDVAPVYQAFLTISKISVGMVVLNEQQFYTPQRLSLIAICASLIVMGIWINLQKSHMFQADKNEEIVREFNKPLIDKYTLQEMQEIEPHSAEVAHLQTVFKIY